MTINDLKNIQPIPGFDCVKMKHDIQAKIHEETKDMTWDQRREYYRRGSEALQGRMAGMTEATEGLVLREEPPDYGTKQS